MKWQFGLGAFSFLLVSLIAHAEFVHRPDGVHLVRVYRKGISDNTIQIDAIVQNCQVVGVDFYYLMDGDPNREQRSMIESGVRNIFGNLMEVPAGHAGACTPGNANCSAKAIRLPLIEKVGLSDNLLAIQAIKVGSRCITVPSISINGKTVQLTDVYVTGEKESVSIAERSAVVRVDTARVIGQGGFDTGVLKCPGNCRATLHL
jgi:hypothetical protein